MINHFLITLEIEVIVCILAVFMIKSPSIANDAKRVDSLRKLQLLDTPIEERFERITRMARQSLNTPIAAFTLVDDTRQTFKSVQGTNGQDVSRDLSMCGHVIANGDMMVVPDTQKDERFADNPIVNTLPGIRFYAGCPVHAPDGEKIGVICAFDTVPRDMTDDQLQSLQDMARMVETELRANLLSQAQTELIQELDTAQRFALIDPLTRLWNRNGINDLLKREWDRALEEKHALSIVIADIDHFKKINDTRGHATGDTVLRYVGQMLLSHLRSDDIIGRLGGEEFLLVLPKCLSVHLKPALERIRSFFETNPAPTDASPVTVTLSFGAVSVMPDNRMTIDQMLSVADAALYTAKESGRNRIEIAQL